MKYLMQKSDHLISKMSVTPLTDSSLFHIDAIENKNIINRESISLKAQYKIDSEIILKPGLTLSLKHTGLFQCMSCSKVIKKIFDGFCFPCLKKKAAADICIMSPHLCHYLAGTCREPEWGEKFCYQPHYVYLSYTDKFKVGITRYSQIPTRWFDQGATLATVLARVTSRHQAGTLEHLLKEILHDKSHWLNMLKNKNERPSHELFIKKFYETKEWLLQNELFKTKKIYTSPPVHLNLSQEILVFNEPLIVELNFDVPNFPATFKSINLDKNPSIIGEITGIKGQYIFMGDYVFNMRRHEGYKVNLEISEN